MLSLADAGAALQVPLWLHFVLWPSLLGWAVVLAMHRRDWAWLRSRPLAMALVPAICGADLAVLIASHDLPARVGSSLGLVLVWLAWLFSITGFFALRRPDRGGKGDGADGDDPEPPWWPDFERQLRDYMRRGPSASAGSPRTPVSPRAG